MTGTSQSQQAASTSAAPHKHVHHGRTVAAWVGTLVALVAFIIGGFALVFGPNWVMFWIAVALIVVALIATVVLQKLGYGAH
jgi:membrane protein YdbS with pleckstrin-like domain